MCTRCITAIIVLVATVLVLESCSIVMNRRFEGERRFYPVDSVWNVGVPSLEALAYVADRSLWGSQCFETCIPFSSNFVRYPFSELRESIASGQLHIDSVAIALLESGIKVSRAILIRNEPAPDSGQIIVGGHYTNPDVPILISDTVTIPVDEDSVRVEFVIWILAKDTNELQERPFSFTLRRREGKKLVLDAR